tara:strand:- start:1619 stop:2170 length:552 start_codon:yes stop_codon:yes gene_type:complete
MKKKPIKSVTIFCSSSNLVDKKYKKLAFNLGKYLASNSINLVYGGGSNGLMGEIARSTKLYGGYVIGVIPKFLSTKENINKKIDQSIIVENMTERKDILYKKGQAFIILPGGPGTLEEMCEIISWYNLGLHLKPIIILNYNNFWNPIIKMYNRFYMEKFTNEKKEQNFIEIKKIQELDKILLK